MFIAVISTEIFIFWKIFQASILKWQVFVFHFHIHDDILFQKKKSISNEISNEFFMRKSIADIDHFFFQNKENDIYISINYASFSTYSAEKKIIVIIKDMNQNNIYQHQRNFMRSIPFKIFFSFLCTLWVLYHAAVL